VTKREPSLAAVTREEFETQLHSFARIVSADKRKTFWRRDGKDYAWVEHPEKRAQDLLHVFLQAKFDGRVNVFEELGTGAGRLDLYLQFFGGLTMIIELKICGFGYSSSYAAAGQSQLIHYMRNRHSNLGYLVVFDARLASNGEELISAIFTKFIDMRPRVTARPA
jgi:hypothetical protein